MTATGHILNGSKPTFKGSQYISTTTDPAVALKWKQEGQITVKFDTDDVIPDVVGNKNILDVSTPDLAKSNGIKGQTPVNFASSSKEVLVEGHVPSNKLNVVNEADLNADIKKINCH